MTKNELTNWALASGWQIIAGHPSLIKPSTPDIAIVRLVLKATVVSLEIKKPAGKWEKISTESYSRIDIDPETGLPGGVGLATLPGLSKLMQDNKDRQVFTKMGLPKP